MARTTRFENPIQFETPLANTIQASAILRVLAASEQMAVSYDVSEKGLIEPGTGNKEEKKPGLFGEVTACYEGSHTTPQGMPYDFKYRFLTESNGNGGTQFTGIKLSLPQHTALHAFDEKKLDDLRETVSIAARTVVNHMSKDYLK